MNKVVFFFAVYKYKIEKQIKINLKGNLDRSLLTLQTLKQLNTIKNIVVRVTKDNKEATQKFCTLKICRAGPGQ